MARTLPAAWSTAAALAFGKPLLLHDLSCVATPLFITSGADSLSFDGNTYRAWQMEVKGGLGPTLDWRGGLAAENKYTISIIQDQEELAGTGENNAMSRFEDTWGKMSYDGTNKNQETSIGASGGSVAEIYIVWDDGSPILAEAVKIHTAVVRDLGMSDYGPLEITLGSERDGFLGRTFLNTLGEEGSGDENYSTTIARDIAEASEGLAVPIVYGEHPYALGIVVHDQATHDDTVSSGMMIAFSDNRFATVDRSEEDPELYVYDSLREQDIPLSVTSYQTVDEQFEFVETPVSIPETNLTAGGTVVRFLDNVATVGGSNLTGGGELVLRYGPITLTPVESVGTATTTDIENLYVDEETTEYTNSTDESPAGPDEWARWVRWKIPTVQFFGEFWVMLVKTAYVHNGGTYYNVKGGFGTSVTPGDPNITAAVLDSTSTNQAGAVWEQTTADFNNLGRYSGWSTTDTEDALRVWRGSGRRTPQDISEGYMVLGLNDPGGDDSADYPTSTEFYFTEMVILTRDAWSNYINRIYGAMEGIVDSTYHGASSAVLPLEIPADIFYHFVEEVAADSGRVDTTAVGTAYTQMSGDSLEMAVNLTNNEETAGEVIEKIGLQSMSHIFPGDDGKEVILYRPDMSVSVANAEAPITESEILAGTFSWNLTSREDVYAGVILKYNYHGPSGRYLSEKRIMPTGAVPETTLTSDGATFTALADTIDADSDKILTIKADYIYDEATAEKLCKWYFQQHMKRRQLCEFELPLEYASILQGDVVAVVHPMIVSYSGGSELAINHTTHVCDKQHGGGEDIWPMYAATGDPALAEHAGDVLVISGGGPNDGTWRITTITDNDTFTLDGGHSLADQSGTPEPWRVIPAQTVLSAQVVYSKQKGARVAVSTIEFPILRPGAAYGSF